MKKPKIQKQGTIKAKFKKDKWIIKFPNGKTVSVKTKKAVEKLSEKWFNENLKKGYVGIGTIEFIT